MACISCDLFSGWDNTISEYAMVMSYHLMPHAKRLCTTLITTYWVFRLMKHMAGAELDLQDLGKEIFISTIVATIMTTPSIWTDLMDTVLQTGLDLATYFIQPGGSPAQPGLRGLLQYIETPLYTIVQGTRAMTPGVGTFDLGTWLGGIILLIAFLILWFFVVFDAIWFYTRFMFIQALGPLILIAFAVPMLRGMASQAWKILLSGLLEFIGLGMIVGLAQATLESALAFSPIGSGGISGGSFMWGPGYIRLLFIAGILIFLRTTFNHLAARLADAISDSAPTSVTKSARAASAGIQTIRKALGRIPMPARP